MVAAAMAVAAMNSGDNGSGAKAVAAEQASLVDWVEAKGQRRRPQWDGGGSDGGASGRQQKK